jgi:hypothetical protein
MGSLLATVFTNDLRDAIDYSIYFLITDDIKIYSSIKSPEDVNMLHSDTDSAQDWCNANFMKPIISKTKVSPSKEKLTLYLRA